MQFNSPNEQKAVPFVFEVMASCSSASSGKSGPLNSIFKCLSLMHPTLKSSLETAWKMASSVVEKYEKMVIEDPEKVAKLESTLNLVSFLLPGHFKSSELLSELVYFATKMMSLLHDVIYRKKFSMFHEFLWNKKSYLEATLTVLEYVEAFVELGAMRVWGEVGKWVVIFSLQIFKAFLKVILLYYFNSGIQSSPSLVFIREKCLFKEKQKPTEIPEEQQQGIKGDDELHSAWEEANEDQVKESKEDRQDVWSGRRSGRVFRSLKNSPSTRFRDWKLPKVEESQNLELGIDYYKLKSKLSHTDRAAELAYILRPLAHLTSMFICGEKSWKPWLLSLAVDMSSIHHLGSKKCLYKLEKDELLKRKVKLLMYLLRSPFYDRHSKAKLVAFLTLMGDKIPLIGAICKPLLQYLPVWQGMYSHTWSN